MKIPVLFETDPDTDEKTGAVHPFCCKKCRLTFTGRPDFVDMVTPGCTLESGEADSSDFDGCICTECCGPLTGEEADIKAAAAAMTRNQAAEYAAQWGCDPVYDRAPNEKGDGYLFYNFATEWNNPEFRAKFIPAIERTIQGATDEADKRGLAVLLQFVRDTNVFHVFECGGCDCYHPIGFTGDCRDDANRFTGHELDEKYGPDGWEVFPEDDEDNDNLEPDEDAGT